MYLIYIYLCSKVFIYMKYNFKKFYLWYYYFFDQNFEYWKRNCLIEFGDSEIGYRRYSEFQKFYGILLLQKYI